MQLKTSHDPCVSMPIVSGGLIASPTIVQSCSVSASLIISKEQVEITGEIRVI